MIRGARLTLIATAGLLATTTAALAIRWVGANYVPTPTPIVSPPSAPIQHAPAFLMASRALAEYARLRPASRAELRVAVREAITGVGAWADSVRDGGYTIVCLGEHHTPATRRFLARTLLPRLAPDVLMLETSASDLAHILARVGSGERRVALLGADIAAVVRGVRRSNPAVTIVGIDESAFQVRRRMHGMGGFRDQSIEANLRVELRPRRRNVILIGALHCTSDRDWLYERLRHGETRVPAWRSLNVHVVGVHQEAGVEALAFFLETTGTATGSFAVPDTARLPRFVLDWFPTLVHTFASYRAAVVFTD